MNKKEIMIYFKGDKARFLKRTSYIIENACIKNQSFGQRRRSKIKGNQPKNIRYFRQHESVMFYDSLSFKNKIVLFLIREYLESLH